MHYAPSHHLNDVSTLMSFTTHSTFVGFSLVHRYPMPLTKHALSYLIQMHLHSCGDLQGDVIIDVSSMLSSYQYVEFSF